MGEVSGTRTKLSSLVANGKYVFYVKAKCTTGLSSIASERNAFDLSKVVPYGSNCPKIADFGTTTITDNLITLAWDVVLPTHSAFKIRYHDTQDPVTQWHEYQQNNLSAVVDNKLTYTLSSLKPNRSYEVEIQAACGTDLSDKSPVKTITTLKAPPVTSQEDFQCGRLDNAPQPDMATCGQASLTKGMAFYAGEFEIVVDAVPAPGYTGAFQFGQRTTATGTMQLPYANYAPATVKLLEVEVDKDRRLCRGQVQVWKVTLYPAGKDVTDAINAYRKQVHDGLNLADSVLTDAEQVVEESEKYFTGGGNVGYPKTGEIGPIDLTSTQTLTAADIQVTNGKVSAPGSTQNPAAPAVILSNDSTLFQADKNGTVTKVGKKTTTPLADTTVDFSKGQVLFAQGPGPYDFDAYQPLFAGKTRVEREYQLIGKTYRVPSQFIEPKAVTTVKATFSGQLTAANLHFVSRKGVEYEKTALGTNGFLITVLGGPHGDAQEIFAVYHDNDRHYTVGKLLLPAYEPVYKNVVLIPVGDQVSAAAYQDSIQSRLNSVYGRVGVHYTVSVAAAYDEKQDGYAVWDLNHDHKLQEANSATFSNNYTGEERALVQAYLESRLPNPDDKTAYLFLLNEIANSSTTADLLGKMPHQEQFGFIFVGAGTNGSKAEPRRVATTVAHELGHGAHFLDHPFLPTIGFNAATEPTQNIMDYHWGTELWKMQWDQLHDPGHVWGVFKRDEDAEYRVLNASENLRMVIDHFRNLYLNNQTTKYNDKFFGLRTSYAHNVRVGNKSYGTIIAKVINSSGDISGSQITKGEALANCPNCEYYIDLSNKVRIVLYSIQERDEIYNYIKEEPNGLLILVNGYRNKISPWYDFPSCEFGIKIGNDPTQYWGDIGEKFITTLAPHLNVVYADGHASINTSNHLEGTFNLALEKNIHDSKCKFLKSAFFSLCANGNASDNLSMIHFSRISGGCQFPLIDEEDCIGTVCKENDCSILNEVPNNSGYAVRYHFGQQYAHQLLGWIEKGTIVLPKNANKEITGTIDIVAHSMGYAFAHGMTDVLKAATASKKLGRFYIIAPENAVSGTTFNYLDFEEVWQYGTDERTPKKFQDGIAPQGPVKGLDWTAKDGKYARVPFAGPEILKNFLDAHSISSYGWIFDGTIAQGRDGYVKQR